MRGGGGQAETREEPNFETCGEVKDFLVISVQVNFLVILDLKSFKILESLPIMPPRGQFYALLRH